jgi:hypothetical protein
VPLELGFRSGRRCQPKGSLGLVGGDADEQAVQVVPGELPVEGPGHGVVALLEGSQAGLDLGQVGEVVGADNLALHHREVDLDLVLPGGVDGQVDEPQVLKGASSRSIEAWPRWELPLSTTQNTRSAEA